MYLRTRETTRSSTNDNQVIVVGVGGVVVVPLHLTSQQDSSQLSLRMQGYDLTAPAYVFPIDEDVGHCFLAGHLVENILVLGHHSWLWGGGRGGVCGVWGVYEVRCVQCEVCRVHGVCDVR